MTPQMYDNLLGHLRLASADGIQDPNGLPAGSGFGLRKQATAGLEQVRCMQPDHKRDYVQGE